MSISGSEGLARRQIAAVTRIAIKMLIWAGGEPLAWMILVLAPIMRNTSRKRRSWGGSL